MVQRARLAAVEQIKICSSCWEPNHDSLVFLSVTNHCTNYATLAPESLMTNNYYSKKYSGSDFCTELNHLNVFII